MERYDPSFFNQPVVIRPAPAKTGPQGGANPAKQLGKSYKASVQWKGTRSEERALGEGTISLSITSVDVLLDRDPNDTFIPALTKGAAIELPNGSTAMLLGKPRDNTFNTVLWRLYCEVTE